jgi:hypothetical protein
MAKVIRVEVIEVSGHIMDYRDVVTRARGRADVGQFDLPPGTEAVVELDAAAGRTIVIRVLEPAQGPSDADLLGDTPNDESPILVNGEPAEFPAAEIAIAVGQVRTAEIPFTSFRTGSRDQGRTAKRRPCVVVELDVDHAAVCPLHGRKSAVGRSESGRKLLGWRALGLKKSSSVDSASVWVTRESLGDLIGVLDTDDRRRLGL